MSEEFKFLPESRIESAILIDVSPSDILNVKGYGGREIIRISPDGILFWNGRLVETDEDFKRAVLEMGQQFIRIWGEQ